MASRMGFLLERNVKKLFELAGFQPELNKVINDYEIDVYVKYKTIDLVIECKQYEKSTLALRNLIHQWDSKNREIKATKVLLVVVGVPISEKDLDLANKYGIAIWDEGKLSKLLDEAIEERDKIKNKILLEAGLKGIKELDEEIKNICKKYSCSKAEAIMLLRGELTEERLRQTKEFEQASSDLKKKLEPEDLQLLQQNAKYGGVPFKKVFEMMVKYRILDKKLARLFVIEGGSFKGEKYSQTKIKKMKLLMGELDYSFDEANQCAVQDITIKDLKRIIKLVKKENITFEEAAESILKKKFSITQVPKRKIEYDKSRIEGAQKKEQKRGFLRRLFD